MPLPLSPFLRRSHWPTWPRCLSSPCPKILFTQRLRHSTSYPGIDGFTGAVYKTFASHFVPLMFDIYKKTAGLPPPMYLSRAASEQHGLDMLIFHSSCMHTRTITSPATKLVRSLGKISCAAACCGMLLPAHVGTYTSMGADRQGRKADVVPNTFPIHQKSEDLCNNREELTGKTLPFPGIEPRTLERGTWYVDH